MSKALNQTQSKVQLKIDEFVIEMAEEVLNRVLSKVVGCELTNEELRRNIEKFKTLDDLVATLTGPDGYNEYIVGYPCTVPSVKEFLTAVALATSLCYYDVATPTGVTEVFCDKFFRGLGEFIASNDARAFLLLDHDYSD
jgi:hypothetical protein